LLTVTIRSLICGTKMVTTLKHYKTCNDDVSELRFLLHGQIGAGKSSIINTIKSIFENRQFVSCLAATTSGTSYTLDYQKYTAGSENTGRLPFAFYDVMGLENNSGGVHTDDIIKALKGHIQNGYKFKPDQPISEDSEYYISKPRLSDKIHCLVSVVATDRIVLMEDVISKMKLIRKEASELGIPQVVFMTRVDEACVLTKNDLSRIYRSRKIKDKVSVSDTFNKLGIPLNCIFPVKNYHDETGLNDNINCLMLEALTQIVLWADDYLENTLQHN
uniref:G domain-containing protein n=1 Tax=Pygocentrus nattereri TaxID=42514 RepID=A0A3B4DGF4_PYGNA